MTLVALSAWFTEHGALPCLCVCSVKVATDLLKKHSWQVERAVDAWFNEARPAEPPKVGDSKKLQVVFNKFAGSKRGCHVELSGSVVCVVAETDKTKDLMQDEKLAEFFASIGIDAAGVGSLAVAHQLGCKTLGLIRRSEFQDGWATLGSVPSVLCFFGCVLPGWDLMFSCVPCGVPSPPSQGQDRTSDV